MKVTESMVGAGVNVYLRDTEISELVKKLKFIEELEGLIHGTLLSDLLTKLKEYDDENKELIAKQKRIEDEDDRPIYTNNSGEHNRVGAGFRPEFHERV